MKRSYPLWTVMAVLISLLAILHLWSVFSYIYENGWSEVWNGNMLKDFLVLLACVLYALDYFLWYKTGWQSIILHTIIAVLLLFNSTLVKICF